MENHKHWGDDMNTAKRNSARPQAILPEPQKRIDACDNINTPLAVRLILARDENPDVRYALAENHNIPEIVLNLLT